MHPNLLAPYEGLNHTVPGFDLGMSGNLSTRPMLLSFHSKTRETSYCQCWDNAVWDSDQSMEAIIPGQALCYYH